MLRLAVIGTNFVTDWLLEALAETPGAMLAGVYSRSEARAREYAARYGASRIYTDLTALAADSHIDAVYIASPNAFHEAQTVAMLRAGKHVLCEKPMAADAAALERMMAAARESGRVLMEAMVPAHLPCFRTLPDVLQKIAPIRRATLQFSQYSSRYDKFKQGIVENAFDPALANGALMDLGVYCLHVMQMLFGTPRRIVGVSLPLPGSIDGAGSILACYENLLCEILYSKISQGCNPSEIQGEGGSLFIDSLTKPREWTIAYRDGRRETLDVTPPLHRMHYELADFLVQCDGESIPEFNKNTLAVTKMMDEARRQMGICFHK